MRTTLKHTLAACIALSALMLVGTACTQDDDLQQPAGTHLLALGEVTIAGAQTATATRADITQDDKGYTGIRKTKFVTGDALALVLNDGSTNTASITATLDANGTWTLPKTYFTAGTKLFATYTAPIAAGMTYGDNLAATNQELKADGTKLSLTLTHANAQVEITPPNGLTPAGGTGTGIVYTDLTVNITPTNAGGGATPSAQTLATAQEGTDTHLRHRTIAPANAQLNSVSLVVNGITYTAPITGTPTLDANKRYPIALTITGDVLTATVGNALDWGTGTDFEGIPAGYDHYIRTVADLVAFRDAVNGGASTVKALQMADIDLSGAGNWTPIGDSSGRSFKGSYNGNGHTISNLTITQESSGTNNRLGLFGEVTDAKITGVHLRNCKITSTVAASVTAGALVAHCRASIITLCSATGIVDINGSGAVAGGMIGAANPGASTNDPNYITRCSADVAVTHTSSNQYVGGFAAYSTSTYYAGCIASGTVNKAGTGGSSSGFSNTDNQSTAAYHAFGCIASSAITDTYKYAFRNITTVNACLSTPANVTFYGNIGSSDSSIDNACASQTSQAGVTHNIAPGTAYAALTLTNAPSNGKMKTLHYSKEDGYTLDVVERTWHAKDIWQNNGTSVYPTINMGYEGTPEPITTGNTIYKVNGYFVTAPETNEATTYTWDVAQTLCATTDAIKKGWRLPSMKDFEVMGGLTTPFTGIDVSGMTIANNEAFALAFPSSAVFWSSDDKGIYGWCLSNNGNANYAQSMKNISYRVRCVQKIAP